MPLKPFMPPEGWDEHEVKLDADAAAEENPQLQETIEDDGSRDAGATDQTPSAVDQRDMAKQEQKARHRSKQIEKFWTTVLTMPGAQDALWDFLAWAGTFEDRFACGPNGFPQPDASWHNAGKRSAGEYWRDKLMAHNPEAYIEFLKGRHPSFPKRRVRR